MNATTMTTSLVRFSVRQRVEHVVMMTSFTLLALTGFPQKFYQASWAHDLSQLFGGVVTMRYVHRVFGVLFTLLVLGHFAVGLWALAQRKVELKVIVPWKKDFQDAITMLRYYLGATREHPRFDRFDYRQKFEYWGLVMGAVIMIVTGFVLMYPVAVAQALPGQVLPAAKIAHSSEGLMAFLVVILWHIYNAHLNPDVFPFDKTIFTGRISRERMVKEHPLELERLEGRPVPPEEPAPQPAPPAEPKPAPALLASEREGGA
jgi:formate dehydrogenase subunit gamma